MHQKVIFQYKTKYKVQQNHTGAQTEFESGGGQTRTYIIKLGSPRMLPNNVGGRRKFFNLKPLKTSYNDILAKPWWGRYRPTAPPHVFRPCTRAVFTINMARYVLRLMI